MLVWESTPYKVVSTNGCGTSVYRLIIRLDQLCFCTDHCQCEQRRCDRSSKNKVSGKIYRGFETYYKINEGPHRGTTIPIVMSINQHNNSVVISEGSPSGGVAFIFTGKLHEKDDRIELIGTSTTSSGEAMQIMTTLKAAYNGCQSCCDSSD